MNWRACKAIAMAVLAMTFLYSLMSILSTSPTNALQIASVGYLPTDIAVDTYTNHVFVVNYGSGDTTPTPSVSILDARSGVVQATVNVDRFPYLLALDSQHHRAIVAIGGVHGLVPSSLIGIDTRTGKKLWRTIVSVPPLFISLNQTKGEAFLGVAVHGSRPGGLIDVMNTVTGRVLGRVVLNFSPKAAATDEKRGLLFVFGSGQNGTGRLLELDTRTNSVKETVAAGIEPSDVTVDVRHRRVYVLNVGREPASCVLPGSSCRAASSASVFDEGSGRVLHTVSVGQNPSRVVVDEHTQKVFVMNDGNYQGGPGSVSVLGGQSGRLLRTTTIGPNPSNIAVDARRMLVFIVDNRNINVFAARDGRLLGTLSVAPTPYAIAIDEAVGHIFVTSSNDTGPSTPVYMTRNASLLVRILIGIGTTMHQLGTLRGRQPGVVSVFRNVSPKTFSSPTDWETYSRRAFSSHHR